MQPTCNMCNNTDTVLRISTYCYITCGVAADSTYLVKGMLPSGGLRTSIGVVKGLVLCSRIVVWIAHVYRVVETSRRAINYKITF
ncbi:hypothetical protein V1517DRAFT_319452 [Lipomyces orientalis]|uniref:Uncharacterized protein n=1 Tax=Lipomyces orientalis TaxID=1233043 RepID=A0ACC3TSC4_9ASCO